MAACFVTIATGSPKDDARQKTGQTVVYIVRHAEKTGEQANADLSEAGKSRADVLKWMLRDISLDAIYSTDTARTRHTVEPTAKAKQVKLTLYTPHSGKLVQAIRRHHTGQSLLVCGHSNTVPELLKSLGVGIKEHVLEGFDDLFIVTIDSPADSTVRRVHLQRLHYPGSR